MRQCFDGKRQTPAQVPPRAAHLLWRQVSAKYPYFLSLLSLHPQSMCQNKSIISTRRWRGHLEAPRGFFSLPWKGEKGVSELFFEVRVVGGAARCREGELNVAQLVTGEGGEGDKLLLRGGLLGIQVENTQICKSLSCSTEWIECTQCQLEGLVFWTDSCTISLFPGWGGWQGCPA